jgi:hypothetical protein
LPDISAIIIVMFTFLVLLPTAPAVLPPSDGRKC